jgi:hypothetical protein
MSGLSLRRMMEELSELKLAEESVQLIEKDFGLEERQIVIGSDDASEELHRQLTRIVQYLLDKDFNRLLNAMYRIDIPEQQVKNILNIGKPDQLASDLADAIIQREKQKVITRFKYSR